MKSYRKRKRDFQERESKAVPLKDALKDMFNEYHLTGKLSEMKLINSWERLMGKTISTRTSQIYIKNKTLFVHLTSAPLKNELSMSKRRIMDILEKEAGKGVIEDIRFL